MHCCNCLSLLYAFPALCLKCLTLDSLPPGGGTHPWSRGYPIPGLGGYPVPGLVGYLVPGSRSRGVPQPRSRRVPHPRSGGYPIPGPGRGVPGVPPWTRSGLDRTAQQVLATWQAVYLLHSRRRTFLFTIHLDVF